MAEPRRPAARARGRLARRLRGFISQYPSIYLPLASRRRAFDGTSKVVGPRTEVVIEGFPRCGNSFAFAAFRLAQPEPVTVAHHLHAPAQVLAAARRGVPTLVVIREPDDAIVSFLLRSPSWTPGEAYAAFERFYVRIRPVRKHFVIATFQQVTSDFGEVTRRLNDRFGTSFAEFEHSPENVERCFQLLDHVAEVNRRRGEDLEMSVARPSAAREERKAEVQQLLGCPSLASARRSAGAIHRDFVQEAFA